MPRLSYSGRAVVLVAMSAIPALPLCAQWSAPSGDTLRRILTDRTERGGSVGVVMGVIERGVPRIVAVGRQAGEGPSPLDGNTIFEIGSVSKVFTTTLLAEMVSRGEVSLDDPVQKYLPKVVTIPSRNGRAITLLDLATASSGLPRLRDDFTLADLDNPYADYAVEHMYSFLSGHALRREPGAEYVYSNLGMGLLGPALALRAGMSYAQLVTERILKPLGMTDTRIVLTSDMRSRLATGHTADMTPTRNWDIPTLAGAGAWRSSVNDLLRFLAANLSPPEGSLGKAIALAVAPRRPAGSPSLRIGLGWHVLERSGRSLVWHNGQTGGYHSFAGFDP
ncbi:MAG: serine hydrolase domain-containing protein, partial [Gemmatimonadaceae bacterium]